MSIQQLPNAERDTQLIPFEFTNFGGGDNFDLPPTAIPVNASWDSQNVDFDKTTASKRTGYNTTALQVGGVSITVAGGSVRLIEEFFDTNNKQWIIIATNSKVYTFDVINSILTDRTPAVATNGVLTEAVVGVSFFGKYFVTNNVDQPYYWDGVAALFVYLTGTGAPQRAMTVKPFGAHLIWGGVRDSVLGEKPFRVVWSDFQNGLLYNAGDSASVDLEDTNDNIIAQEVVQNFMAIGREKSIWNCQFIGSPFFYRFDRKVDVDGIVGARLFIKTPLGLMGLSKNNIILYNGASVKYIGQGIINDLLQLSNKYIRNGHMIYNDLLSRVEVFVTGRTDGFIDRMYAYSILYATWRKIVYNNYIMASGKFKSTTFPVWTVAFPNNQFWVAFPIKWADLGASQLSPQVVYGDDIGKVYDKTGVANDNLVAIQGYFKSQVSELNYPGFKEVQVIELLVKGQVTGILTVNLLAYDDGFNITSYGPYTLDMTKVPVPKIYLNAQGRYFSLHILNNNLNETYEVRLARLYYNPRTTF
jgi:hypothetical protein